MLVFCLEDWGPGPPLATPLISWSSIQRIAKHFPRLSRMTVTPICAKLGADLIDITEVTSWITKWLRFLAYPVYIEARSSTYCSLLCARLLTICIHIVSASRRQFLIAWSPQPGSVELLHSLTSTLASCCFLLAPEWLARLLVSFVGRSGLTLDVVDIIITTSGRPIPTELRCRSYKIPLKTFIHRSQTDDVVGLSELSNQNQ